MAKIVVKRDPDNPTTLILSRWPENDAEKADVEEAAKALDAPPLDKQIKRPRKKA